MQGYQINQENGKWIFQLIPNNSNEQSVGWSKQFDSREECAEGVKQFRELVVEHQIKTVDSPYIALIKDGKCAHFEYRVDGEMLFRSRVYNSTAKSVCNTRVWAIFNQIDSYTSNLVE